MNIDFNKIYNSNNYGPFNIIEDCGSNGKRHFVKIRFINTGFEKIVRYDTALAGKVRDDLYNIDFNKLYESNSYGKVKILEYLGRDDHCDKLVKVQFLNSKAISIVRLHELLNGKISDPYYGIDFDKLYNSNNYGKFKFISIVGNINNHIRVIIEFTNTGNRKEVQLQNAFIGEVCDDKATFRTPLKTKDADNPDKYIEYCIYGTWKNMMDRCFNIKSNAYKNYGYIGITVSDEWKIYDNFRKDVENLPQFNKFYNNPRVYNLDKDYLQQNVPINKRVYSKETCMFLHYTDNCNLRTIEYKRNNPNLSSKYYGVFLYKGLYSVNICINNNNIFLGAYTNEIVAANVYNYWSEYYHNYELIRLYNDVPYIDKSEFIKYNKRSKILANIIN